VKFAVLTSHDTRHRYFANVVTDALDVVAIGYQETAYIPADTDRDTIDPDTAAILKQHFDERTRQEQAYFGHASAFIEDSPKCAVRRLDPTTLSSEETVQFLEEQGTEAVLVYGTSLIKPPLLDHFAGRMINMHLGLSPYYRGTATNFYPLLNKEPEYVGATIHLIDAGIDSGAIIHHARPEITADDMPHTVGCKAILCGIEKIIQSAKELESGNLRPVPQWPVPSPKLYLRRDYHPSQVVELYNHIAEGLFKTYAESPTTRNPVTLVP
jgi:phosphoribosylglycinamide formyltransferase 1